LKDIIIVLFEGNFVHGVISLKARDKHLSGVHDNSVRHATAEAILPFLFQRQLRPCAGLIRSQAGEVIENNSREPDWKDRFRYRASSRSTSSALGPTF
jgi:hypothetical protein